MEIEKGKKEELDVKAAEIILDAITERSKKKTTVVFGISGGASVGGALEVLKRAGIKWTFVEIFMLDECLSGDDKDSTVGQAKKLFIDELIEKGELPARNVHYFGKKDKVQDYAGEFLAAGGKFDVVLAGLEIDCRIAGLFPGGVGLVEDESFVVVKDAPINPKKRMTVTKKALEGVGDAVLLAYGLDKKEALANFLDEKREEECPADFLKAAENLNVLCDVD